MALNLNSTYPGKTEAPSTPYPYGKARNITSPGDGTGTPWEAAIVNDMVGFFQAMLSAANIVPTNNPDSATASQYLDSLKALFPQTSIYGVGGLTQFPPGNDLDLTDNSVSTGLYRFGPTTSGVPNGLDGSPITGDGVVYWSRRAAGGGEAQMLLAEDEGQMLFRTRVTSGWTAWRAVYNDQNVVGDVADGAILEEGQNVNGQYTLFKDGTLICRTRSFRSPDANGDDTWTFPKAFTDSPEVSFTNVSTGANTFNVVSQVSVNTVSVDIKNFFWDGTTFAGASNSYRATAIGRAF